ncbi:MAG: hypothetical protein JWO82_703 [Akkermansiaceae bacterium]|nr:hypothetical protein [Akkermansiaceae bacterium]
MKRRSAWIFFSTALVPAIAGLSWLSFTRTPGPTDALAPTIAVKSHVTSRPPPLPARMRRFFDAPSLERWIASGNIAADQAAHLQGLLDAGQFEEAVRYGLNLPDTSLSRPTAVYYAWFAWGSNDRDRALTYWQENPETQGEVALDGLTLGIAFSQGSDPLAWLEERHKVPAEGNLQQRLLTTVGVMWLISGEIEAAPFVRMASRVRVPSYQQSEFSAAISSLAEQCTDLIAAGRLKRKDGAEILLRLRSALEQQVAGEAPDPNLETDYHSQLGSAAGKMIGVADSIAAYDLPADELSRQGFLVALASELRNEPAVKVAALAASDPIAGPRLWESYAIYASLNAKAFASHFSDPALPENLLTAALDAGLDAGIQELDESHAAKWLDQLPDGRLKNQAMLRLAARLEQDGHAESAERWRQKAAAKSK